MTKMTDDTKKDWGSVLTTLMSELAQDKDAYLVHEIPDIFSKSIRCKSILSENNEKHLNSGNNTDLTARMTDATKKEWSSVFTTPISGPAQDNYTYLVHGIQNVTSRFIQHTFILSENNRKYYNSDRIDLLIDPVRDISRKKTISCSLIDNKHLTTFGGAGLVLRTPPENILEASPQDIGSNFYNATTEITKQRNTIIPSPKQILQQTLLFQHNEILLQGKTDAGELEVIGFFIKTKKNGQPTDEEVGIQIKILAQNYGLPIVEIPATTAQHMNKAPELLESVFVKDELSGIQFIRDGLVYNIFFKKSGLVFETVDDECFVSPMTREQVKYAKNVVQSEISTKDRERVKSQLELNWLTEYDKQEKHIPTNRNQDAQCIRAQYLLKSDLLDSLYPKG